MPQSSGFVAPVSPGDDEDKEEALVKKHQSSYDAARKFDENYRKQIAKDRRYAAGTWDVNWAVSANIVGYIIDILLSILYARDPDVSVRKVPQVDDEAPGNTNIEAWAKTLETVISLLFKKSNLRTRARQQVRSGLTVSTGWIKALLLTEDTPQPEIETQIEDAMTRKAQIKAQRELINDPMEGALDPDEMLVEEEELDSLIDANKKQLEESKRQDYVIEFLPAESVQMSLDVARDEDYLDADWIAFDLFIPKEELCDHFERLEPDDIKLAREYYQRKPTDLAARGLDNDLPQGQLTAESAEMYTSAPADEGMVKFARVIEKWCRKDGHIYTWVEGVKKYAKEPFKPNFVTTRFYPCFRLAFYETDGERHPQSVPYRISKLQDEYSCTRSNFRLTRERNIPGIIVNGSGLSDEELKKLAGSKIQEIVALKPLDPGVNVSTLFAPKPASQIDPRLFDTSPIMADIERITGAQEALQGAASAPKTATEAQLQQTGLNARTTSDRDNLEWMLSELALYTAEVAIQGYKTKDIQQMVGAQAFWPEGLGINAIHRMVNICIQAGSTGKPKKQQDQQTWGVVLPLMEKMMSSIVTARMSGNTALAKALEALVTETMERMGDNTDVEKFIPQVAATPPTPPPPPPPQVSIALKGLVPPQDAAAIASRAVPPGMAPAPGGAPAAPGAQPGAPGVPPGGTAGPIPGQQPGPQGPSPASNPQVNAQQV